MSIPEGMIANNVATTALPWLISFALDREAVFHFHPLGRLDALLAMLWEHFCSGGFAMTSPRLTFTKSARVKINHVASRIVHANHCIM